MQMKRIYGLVAGLLILTGCSKEEQVGDAGNGDRIQFGKAMLVSEAGVSEWNGTSLGVSLLSPGGALDPTQTGYNVELQYTDNGWVSQPALRWTDNAEGTVCDLIAYAPYTSAITDPAAVAVEVAADQSQPGAPQQNDWLYSRSTVTKNSTDSPIQLELKHALSRLVFQVIFDGDYATVAGIEALTVSLKNTGTINLNDGTVSVADTKAEMSPCLLQNTVAGVSQLYELTVLPQEVTAEEFFISFRVNGKSFEKAVTAQFEPGMCYTYRLRIGQDKDPVLMALVPTSITEWDEQKIDLPDQGVTEGEYQAGDVWPNAENPIAYVVRARSAQHPGLMVTILDKRDISFKTGGGLFNTLAYTDAAGNVRQAASNRTDGQANLQTMELCLKQSNPTTTWDQLPILNFSRTLGKDWFIPAVDQWQEILNQIEPDVWTDLLTNYWTDQVLTWLQPLPDFKKTAYVFSSNLVDMGNQGLGYVIVAFRAESRETIELTPKSISYTSKSYAVIAVRYF